MWRYIKVSQRTLIKAMWLVCFKLINHIEYVCQSNTLRTSTNNRPTKRGANRDVSPGPYILDEPNRVVKLFINGWTAITINKLCLFKYMHICYVNGQVKSSMFSCTFDNKEVIMWLKLSVVESSLSIAKDLYVCQLIL